MEKASAPTDRPTVIPDSASGEPPEHAGWIERRLCVPGDNEETRHRKSQFVFAAVLVVPAGLLWGALYFAYGERAVAAIPVAYSVLTFADLLLLFRLRRFELFRWTQQVLMFVLPFALQLALGGFVGSSLVILWSFIAVLMALLFGGAREARWWLAAYVAAVLAAAWLQPGLAIANRLPHRVVLAFFAANAVVVMAIAFVVLYAFVTDRRKLRELEVAYLGQEMMLRQSEKLATLGTLAAGVAHELNNPAAAAGRLVTNLDRYPGLQSYVRMGTKVDLSKRWQLQAGFTENIEDQEATTDFGIFSGIVRRF